MDGAGNYIIGNPDFKSENFFKYLYVFNGLTLDEMNALSASILRTDAGTLRYSNSEGAPCVFLYSRPEGESWYSVSCVPLACFDNAVPDSRLTVLVTVVLSVMLVMTGDVEAIVFLQDITERKKRDEIDQRLTNEIIDYIGLIDLTRHTFEFTNVNMVASGLGVSFNQKLISRDWRGRVAERPFDPPQYISLGIAVPSLREASPAARRFIACVQAVLAERDGAQ